MKNIMQTMQPLDIVKNRIVDIPEWRDCFRVFLNRQIAAHILASMLKEHSPSKTSVVAISSGAIPIALELLKTSGFSMEVASTATLVLPWDAEAAYGAISYDGTVYLDQTIIKKNNLASAVIERDLEKAHQHIKQQLKQAPLKSTSQSFSESNLILLDDGVDSSVRMRAVIQSIRRHTKQYIAIAAPTGQRKILTELAGLVDKIYCPNIRSDRTSSNEDAYQDWSIVTDQSALETIDAYHSIKSPQPKDVISSTAKYG